MALKCEDREARIFKFLYNDVDGMLRQYEVPTHLSDVRVRDEINLMVGDVNREIPSSIGDASFDLLLIEIGRQVRRRHGARAWPSIKILLTATGAALDEIKLDEKDFDAKPKTPHEINAARIKAGESVSEFWIYGQQAAELVHRGLVEEVELNRYRVAIFKTLERQYGEEYALDWRARKERIHEESARRVAGQDDLIDSDKVKAAADGFDFEEKKAS